MGKPRTSVQVMWVGMFLLAAAGWLLYFFHPRVVTQAVPDAYEFLDPARKLTSQEDRIINFQALRDEFNHLEQQDKNISIYFEFLNTGANMVVNKDAEFWPASLMKVPVAIAVAKTVEKGEWKWTNELIITSNDKDDRFGDLYRQPVGTHMTIEDLVGNMLIKSDNTAYYVLLRNLEPAELANAQRHLGLDEFIQEKGKISAKKYSIVMRALYTASYLNEESSDKILKFMTASAFESYLEAGVPKGIPFSHKVGISDEYNVFLDAGLFYVPHRPYILTVMINTKDEKKAQEQMKDISAKVYNYVANYHE